MTGTHLRARQKVNGNSLVVDPAVNIRGRALRPYLTGQGWTSLECVSGGIRQDAVLAGLGEAVGQLLDAPADAEGQWAGQIAPTRIPWPTPRWL